MLTQTCKILKWRRIIFKWHEECTCFIEHTVKNMLHLKEVFYVDSLVFIHLSRQCSVCRLHATGLDNQHAWVYILWGLCAQWRIMRKLNLLSNILLLDIIIICLSQFTLLCVSRVYPQHSSFMNLNFLLNYFLRLLFNNTKSLKFILAPS